MKKFFKWFFILLFLAVGGFAAYYFLYPTPERRALTVIPEDAVFVVESQEPILSYQKIARSTLWKHLIDHPYFAEMNQEILSLDSLINDNELMFELLGSRYLTLSVHKTKPDDFDFLYVIDLEKESKILDFKDALGGLLEDAGMKLESREYEGKEVLELTDLETKEVLFIGLLDNLMTASYTRDLVLNSIEAKEQDTSYFQQDTHFRELRDWIDEDEMFNIYVNSQYLDDFLAIYSSEDEKESMLGPLEGTLSWGGFEMSMEEKQFNLMGKLFLRDSAQSYLHAMLESGTGARYADQIMTARTAVYTSMQFDNFLDLYDDFVAQYAKDDPEWKENERQIERVEKFLKIDLRTDFFSWFGNEIALISAQPKIGREADNLLAIHTKDIEVARTAMERVTKQIRRRTPGKFKPVAYKDFTIYKFKVKGFFKLFLGKLFSQFDHPYFTYVEDFIVFSNNLEDLQHFLDDYQEGITLTNQELYNDFADEFNSSSNVFVYIDMARYHPVMFEHVDAETWNDARKNRDYLTAFRQIGLQMTGEGDRFDTRLLVNYSEMAPKDLSLYGDIGEEIDEESDSLMLPRDEDGNLIVEFPEGLNEEFHDRKKSKLKRRFYIFEGKYEGDYREYYRKGQLRLQGQYEDGRQVGVWYYYRRNGKLRKKLDYGDGTEDPVRLDD